MGQNSHIQWTDHTFNPWWGCQKVSDGCKFCYAENLSERYGHNVWGPIAPRRFFDDNHWNEPRSWNRKAIREGHRLRVFCGSMCDVFEDRPDLKEPRERLWALIEETPELDWLLLTKRPENMVSMSPVRWAQNGWPRNVWAGTSAEDQDTCDARLTELLRVPAFIRFISAEPLLGPIDFGLLGTVERTISEPYCAVYDMLHWVIVGGESQPGCRPMKLEWARDIVRQCRESGVAVFVKQLGGHPNKRGNPDAWPADLKVREFPEGSLASRSMAQIEMEL